MYGSKMYSNKTQYIILDIQGFMVNEDQFVPKELASCDSNKCITHHVFQPSSSIASLPSKYRNTANWLMTHHHCIDWKVGFIHPMEFDAIVKYLCRNVKKVYVKGPEKIKFLRHIISAPIFALEGSIYKLEMGIPSCAFHSRRRSMCALSNVRHLQEVVEEGVQNKDAKDSR